MSIDTSAISDIDTETVEVANKVASEPPTAPEEANGKTGKPAICLFLRPDFTVGWTVDQKQAPSLETALHCLNTMKAALECDRDTLRSLAMQQRIAQQIAEHEQLKAAAEAIKNQAQMQAFAQPRRMH